MPRTGAWLLAALVAALVALAWWYIRYRRGTVLVSEADGSTVRLGCAAGQRIEIVAAKYVTGAAKPRTLNVTAALQTAMDVLGEEQYVINGMALGHASGGVLTFRYRCAGRGT